MCFAIKEACDKASSVAEEFAKKHPALVMPCGIEALDLVFWDLLRVCSWTDDRDKDLLTSNYVKDHSQQCGRLRFLM